MSRSVGSQTPNLQISVLRAWGKMFAAGAVIVTSSLNDDTAATNTSACGAPTTTHPTHPSETTHTYTHTHARARTHAHTRTRTHAHAHAHANMHTTTKSTNERSGKADECHWVGAARMGSHAGIVNQQ
jgi:hypothetical protein